MAALSYNGHESPRHVEKSIAVISTSKSTILLELDLIGRLRVIARASNELIGHG